jgi:hypothetical protein
MLARRACVLRNLPERTIVMLDQLDDFDTATACQRLIDLLDLEDDEIAIEPLGDAEIAEAIEAEAGAYDPQDRSPLA